MRSPFPVSIYTNRPLTDLQSLRRGRLLEKTRAYREFLNRLRRNAKRRSDQGKLYPKGGGLMLQWAYKMQEELVGDDEVLQGEDQVRGIPHAQMMLEVDGVGKKLGRVSGLRRN